MPRTEEEWKSVADKTFDCWQFPNTVGAMDGKHISLFHPKGSGSEYYNYKGFFSLVMLALVDYDYKFMFIDVGCQGRISDGGVYNNASTSNALRTIFQICHLHAHFLFQKILSGYMIIKHFPFMIISDDGFPLKPQIMKPYSHRNLDDKKLLFNNRASRYQRVTENAFGILSWRFRLFLSRTCLSPETAIDLVLAIVTLHCMLRTKSRDSYSLPRNF